jgi:cyclophilin family peptidyl-prolyl cis-trans isomerase
MRLALVALLLSGCAEVVRESIDALTPRDAELLQIARLEDAAAVDALLPRLDDPTARQRAGGAFALGQLGVAWRPLPQPARDRGEAALLARLARERDRAVRDRLIEALGKLGGTPSIAPLAGLLGDPHEAERAAIAIGLIARRDPKLVPGEVINELDDLLDDPSVEVRWAGVYALARLEREETRPLLLRALTDRAPLVRQAAAKGLADVPAAGDERVLAPLLDDADVRVAAEAARTLAHRALACDRAAACPAIATLANAAHFRAPVMAAISAEPITHPSAAALFADRYQRYAEATAPDRRTRGLAQCRAALAHDRVLGEVQLTARCGLGEVDEHPRARLQALALGAALTGERAGPLIALSSSPDPAVRALAAEGLAALDSDASAERLLALIADPEPEVVAAAAGAVEKRKLSTAASALRARLPRLAGPDAIEALQAVLGALGSLGDPAAVETIRPLAHGTPYAVCLAAEEALAKLGQPERCQPAPPGDSPFSRDPLPAAPKVRIVTSRGTLHARLDKEHAQSAVRNFLGLVRKRFFDGLAWHRVITGFVAQGGDPRGDGSGGPGWTVPCEIAGLRYREGTLGMALSGRDTGGSQFFISHTPQPHLDGRYTIFGQLTDGLDVATSLVEGDRILEIREE